MPQQSEQPQFTRPEIDDAARVFATAAARFGQSDRRTWLTALHAFLHATRDRVLAEAVRPLRTYEIDLERWFRERTSGLEAMRYGGSQPLKFPEEPEAAAALSLQLLEGFVQPTTNLDVAIVAFMGSSDRSTDRFGPLARELLGPLMPYVDQRVTTLRRAAPPSPDAPGQGIYIGSIGNLGALFAGPASVHGANFAAGTSGTVNQTAHAPRSEVARAITGWTELLSDVEEHRHAEVGAAIAALARAADEGGLRPAQLAQVAETVVEAAPSLRARAVDLIRRGVMKVGGALVTAAASEAGTQIVAHHEQVLTALRLALGHPPK